MGTVLAIAVAMVMLFSGPASAKIVTGTAGDDLLKGTNKADTIKGKAGDDLMAGKRGNDKINAGPNEGSFAEGSGDIVLLGGGYDTGKGSTGADVIVDDDGQGPSETKGDVIDGGPDNDIIAAADGGKTTVNCGDGIGDIAIVDPGDTTTGCEVVLDSTGDLAGLFGMATIGTSGADALAGVNDLLPDLIAAKDGDDTINGGNGTDLMAGGAGVDTMNGDAGADSILDDDGTAGDNLNGGSESDQLVSLDGAVDNVDCGDGLDQAVVDKIDIVVNCEDIRK